MRRALACAVTAAVVIVAAGAASGQPAPSAPARPAPSAPARPAAARHKLVLASLTTLGTESTAADIKVAQKLVARGLAATGTADVIDHEVMLDAVKRAKRPELRACDGDAACLAALGQLVGADYVVYGEVGGLGDAQVIYLKLIDVRAAREIRAAVLELGGGRSAEEESRAAAVRLIAPGRYVGTLTLVTNVKGASIFIDGQMRSRSPARPMSLPVGAHALRVTHPEFRDFVRFVDVEFGKGSSVDVSLEPYEAVSGDVRRTGGERDVVRPTGPTRVQPTPWYRRWYTVAGGAAILFITSAVVVGAVSGGVDFDREKQVP